MGEVDDPDQPFDPLMNGFSVGEISKGNGKRCFVRRSTNTPDDSVQADSTMYEFPLSTEATSADELLILHQPSEVWGYEEGKLILGVVSPNHNNDAVLYEWFRDGECVYSGGCILVVEQPGYYHCRVKVNLSIGGKEAEEFVRDSGTVQVVRMCAEPPPPSVAKEAPKLSGTDK